MVAEDLVASRERLQRIIAPFHGERLLGPKLAIVNPPLWEIGHLGWFQERWCLREGTARQSILKGADSLYDSSAIAHDLRWDLPLPSIEQTKAYLRNVQDHAPGELAAIWQDVIDGYQELATVQQTDRDEMIRDAAKRAVSALPSGASRAEAWAAIGKAGQKALDEDEKADAPHERRADQLLRSSVPSALGSARGACGMSWTKG